MLSFQAFLLSSTFADSLLVGLIGLLASKNLLLATGRAQMRSGNMDLLCNDATIDFLVDNDTNGSLVDIKDDTSAAMVVLEGHTLVHGRVHLDVDIVPSL